MMDMSKQLPPGMALDKVDDNIMTLNVGPQHPGSGHMRLIVKIDGDYIVSCDPDPGYVHRGDLKVTSKWWQFSAQSSGKSNLLLSGCPQSIHQASQSIHVREIPRCKRSP